MSCNVRMVGMIALLVALWASALGGTGLADGGLLISEGWLEDFTEQSQLAVVEVRPDDTAKIDL